VDEVEDAVGAVEVDGADGVDEADEAVGMAAGMVVGIRTVAPTPASRPRCRRIRYRSI